MGLEHINPAISELSRFISKYNLQMAYTEFQELHTTLRRFHTPVICFAFATLPGFFASDLAIPCIYEKTKFQ
jgi:hypothetical protein